MEMTRIDIGKKIRRAAFLATGAATAIFIHYTFLYGNVISLIRLLIPPDLQ